jgi:uncharacterized phage-like protein YoqJ
MSGMAPGFDLWAADEVIRLRAEGRIGADVRLVLAIPYPHFERSFAAVYRPLYEYVLERADEVVYVCPFRYVCTLARKRTAIYKVYMSRPRAEAIVYNVVTAKVNEFYVLGIERNESVVYIFKR